MTEEEKKYLYYLLNFGFVINNPNLYTGIRDAIYKKRYLNDINGVYKICLKYKPISDHSELMSFPEYVRDQKLKIILGD